MRTSFESAIVRIRTADGAVVGAGFLVTGRQVLTCAHVVVRALGLPSGMPEMPRTEVRLDFPLVAPEYVLTAHVILWQPESDVAGLELDGDPPVGAQAVRLVTADDLWEHRFRAYGFPAGHDDGVWAYGALRGRTAAGRVQIEDVKEPGYRVQLGFSGAPVWDERLKGVVGMVVVTERQPEIKAAFIIPADVLIKIWPELGKRVMSKVPASSVQGGVNLREAESIIRVESVEPSPVAIPLPRVRVFEPLPFNRFLVKKLRLDGVTAVFTSWIIFLLMYAGGIWGFRRIMNTPYPQNFIDLLHIAPGFAFYYPDWNAITFDGILNPILAALASIFPLLVAKRLTMLFRSNLLQVGDGSKSWLLDLPPWIIFLLSLLLAIITAIVSWFSRYQFYVSDLLLFRFYVLFLIGLSTYVRWSLLILTIQTVLWILRSDFKPTEELFSPGGEVAICPLGELGILLLLTFYGLTAYAIATIGTSVVKGVPIEIDALFWEAIVHLFVSLVGCGFTLVGLVYRPYWALQQSWDDFVKEVARIEDLLERQERLSDVKKVSMLPIWRAAQRQAILLIPFFLLTLMPLFLWIGGLIAKG